MNEDIIRLLEDIIVKIGDIVVPYAALGISFVALHRSGKAGKLEKNYRSTNYN